MRELGLVLLYTALGWLANPGLADVSAAEALREGDMRKLSFHAQPIAGTDVSFLHEDGSDMSLADLGDGITVLNFWATWCAPCRKEMPSLSALQAALDGTNAQVVTVATGRNPRPAMEAFFDEIGVENLPLHADPRQQFSRAMGVLGLPVTLIIGPKGQEIARLQGDADWSSDSAIAILQALAGEAG